MSEAQLLETNMRTAKEIVGACINIGHSCILLGPPGIGKTEIIQQVASEKGIGFKVFEGPNIDPTDSRGVLVPDGNGGSYFTRSALLPQPEKDGAQGILLIDELFSALPSVQTALHSLFHPGERRLGEHRLPDGWIPMATGNRTSDGAGAVRALTALIDRSCVIRTAPNYEIWRWDYALPNNIHPLVLGFTSFRPDLFCTFDKRNKLADGKTFVTPRSHAAVSKCLYEHNRSAISNDALRCLIAGHAGDGVASEYMAFIKEHEKMPNINEIFKGKNIIPREISVLHALCAALIANADKVPGMTVQKAVDRIIDYALKLGDKNAEFGILLGRDLGVKYKAQLFKSKFIDSYVGIYKHVVLDVDSVDSPKRAVPDVTAKAA